MKSRRTYKCIAPEMGRLITQYELGQLGDEERDRFEEHLMDCDFCRRELQSMLPFVSVIRSHRAEILKGLHNEGISFESLRGRLLVQPRPTQVKRASLSSLWQRILHGFRTFGGPRILVPAAVVVTALLLFAILPFLHHLQSPYLPYLSFEKLPYRLAELRGEEASQAEELFHQGMNSYLRGNYKGAINNLKKAVEKDPNNGIWWLYLGVCYYLDHQAKPAVEALTKADALTKYSQKVRSRWYLAQACLLQGDANKAIPLLEWIRGQKMGYSAQADSLLTKVHPIIR